MQTSKNGLEFIAHQEGEVLHVYKDSVGLKTIGIGHLITKNELSTGTVTIKGIKVEYDEGITEQQALDLLAQDVKVAEGVVKTVVPPLTQNQFDALVSLAFNIGDYAFSHSTLYKTLNANDFDGAKAEFCKWNKAGGKVCFALTSRRAKELELFETV